MFPCSTRHAPKENNAAWAKNITYNKFMIGPVKELRQRTALVVLKQMP